MSFLTHQQAPNLSFLKVLFFVQSRSLKIELCIEFENLLICESETVEGSKAAQVSP
jgi:hypothetical protein